jgi:hypothetical protein
MSESSSARVAANLGAWKPPGWAAYGGVLVLSGLISVFSRQDISWDLCNYHLYNGFALLHGRLTRDLYAAGLQSYLNPLLDAPYYIVSVMLFPSMPRLVAFLAGLPFGILMLLVIGLARSLPPELFPSGRAGAWCAVLIGMSSTTLWAEIGTTFGDIPAAILVVGGILPVARLAGRPAVPRRSWLAAAFLAGWLLGLACGLKLTACVFAPPLALAVGLSAPRIRWVVPAIIAVAVGGAVGLAVSYGWWGWELWRQFGSPVFPYLNDIFHSPWMPAMSGRDDSYLPSGPWRVVFLPFTWLTGGNVQERVVRDPRFALAWMSVVLVTCIAITTWLRRDLASPARLVASHKATVFVFTFGAASFVVWEWYFGVPRYIVALEALSGIVILVGLKTILLWCECRSPWVERGALAAVVVVVIASSAYTNWGRAKTWGAKTFTVEAPALPDGSRVISSALAVSFVLPFLRGDDLTFVGLVNVPPDARLADRISGLLDGDRPVYALTWYQEGIATLRAWHWEIVPGQCNAVANEIRRGVMLCRVRRGEP